MAAKNKATASASRLIVPRPGTAQPFRTGRPLRGPLRRRATAAWRRRRTHCLISKAPKKMIGMVTMIATQAHCSLELNELNPYWLAPG